MPNDISVEQMMARGAAVVVAVASPLVDEGCVVGPEAILDGAMVDFVDGEGGEEFGNECCEVGWIRIVFEAVALDGNGDPGVV